MNRVSYIYLPSITYSLRRALQLVDYKIGRSLKLHLQSLQDSINTSKYLESIVFVCFLEHFITFQMFTRKIYLRNPNFYVLRQIAASRDQIETVGEGWH